MERIVRAFNVLPGKEDRLLTLSEEMRRRAAQASDFYARSGVVHESWYLQRGRSGSLVIAVTVFDNLHRDQAAAAFQSSEDPFDTWFRNEVREICGVDPRAEPLGPLTDCVFQWNANGSASEDP